MKKIVLPLILSFSPLSFATETMDMTCVTEFPTTSFVIRDAGDKVSLQVFNHNGNQYMPIYDSLVTPHDLALLSAKAKVLLKLPETMKFEWPKEKCERQDEMIQTCMGITDEQEHNGTKVQAWSFGTSWATDKTAYGKFNYRKVSLHLTIDKQDYSIPMKYSESECGPWAMMAAKLPAAGAKK